MAVYTISMQKSNSSSEHNLRWHLDYPREDETVDDKVLKEVGLLFQGWFLNEKHSILSLVLLNGNNITPLSFSRNRPDVVAKVLKDEPESHALLQCGFSERITFIHSDFSIGIIENGKFTELLSGSVDAKFKVLKGKDKWLFLDNDTNKSIEQHTGKLKLSKTAKQEWKSYLTSLDDFSRSCKVPVCMLVAPSKEMVYESFYPHKLSKKAPINTILGLVPDSLNFLLPIEELKNLEKRSFRVCDTHWTLHGAQAASVLLTKKLLGEDVDTLKVFETDKYRSREVTGDLGSKIFPPQRHVEDSLLNFNYKKMVIFDNNLENFGRIIVMFNPQAQIKKSLLIFGSSSSYTMFHYLCRLYKTVVFVHTAGNVDHEVINILKPELICMQTNARFVIKAPNFNDSVVKYINRKKTEKALKKPLVTKTIPEECRYFINHFLEMLRD